MRGASPVSAAVSEELERLIAAVRADPRAQDQLLRSIRTAVETGVGDSGVEARIADVRSQVADEHGQSFDELLGEARLLYRLRDERGVYSDIWPATASARPVDPAADGRNVDHGGVQHPAAPARRDRPTAGGCSRTRQWSRANSGSPAWSGRARRPSGSRSGR